MEVQLARETVINAGRKLLETGLIARTWGNVSCRIDDRQFAVTPSGMAYDTLRPEDIVVVNIGDLSYEGGIKPSSEKGIHAEVYRQKPGINFVIHTHQVNASVAGVLGEGVEVADPQNRLLIGEHVPLAAYGLPGTAKLKKNVAAVLKNTGSKAVLMAHHGALCFGAGQIEAFQVARALEDECGRFVTTPNEPMDPARDLGTSRRIGNECVFSQAGIPLTIDIRTGKASGGIPLPPEAALHCAVYRARDDVGAIIGSSLPHIADASAKFGEIKPLLDDFAQIIGPSVPAVVWEGSGEGARRIVKALNGSNAVLIMGIGALCCAGNEGDALAVGMVLDKGCKAWLAASAKGFIRPISPVECRLMRFVYKMQYAKKAEKGKKE
jgi:ribulose-5-phosphate 4-epimerase/fuculose-1-phosphate aldolase